MEFFNLTHFPYDFVENVKWSASSKEKFVFEKF